MRPPQPSPEEQVILRKMRDLAARAGKQLDLPEPEQEPERRTCVYNLLSSADSLAYQAKGMAKTYITQHIHALREAQGMMLFSYWGSGLFGLTKVNGK